MYVYAYNGSEKISVSKNISLCLLIYIIADIQNFQFKLNLITN